MKRVEAHFRKSSSSHSECKVPHPPPTSDEGKESLPTGVSVSLERARDTQKVETTSFVPPVEVAEVTFVDELFAPKKVTKAKSAQDWADFYLSSLRKIDNPFKSSLGHDKRRFTAAEYQSEIGELYPSNPVVSSHSLILTFEQSLTGK
jgi:hypothetical protein